MTVSLWCLVVYAVWTLVLVLIIVLSRAWAIAKGARWTEFPSDLPHGSEAYRRVSRAHANCIENLPVAAAVLLTADTGGLLHPVIDALSVTLVSARIVQSVAHISSGRSRAIAVRATAFSMQILSLLAIVVTMVVLYVSRA